MKPATTHRTVLARAMPRAAALVGDVTAGTVSTLMMLCYAMSLGTLIFSADLARYAELGVPTALVSCIVTAFVIALTSSMRMNIGGPDSNATAFLVGVAAGVASSVRANGGSPTEILLTVLVAIALCSLVTGLILFAIGSSRRSRSLQFLPYPVMGGFLAGTGYLLIAGAFRVLTGVALDWHTLPRLAATALARMGARALRRRTRHDPRAHLAARGGIADHARHRHRALLCAAARRRHLARRCAHMGLLLQHVPTHALHIPELHLPSSLARGEIDWHAIVAHLPETLIVTSVSAITIIMNSTAMGAATGQDIDLNREMRAAGLANIASGLFGGMVGYQSYNRSMLNARAGATSRAGGRVRRARVPLPADRIARSRLAVSGAGARRHADLHGPAAHDGLARRRVSQAHVARISARAADSRGDRVLWRDRGRRRGRGRGVRDVRAALRTRRLRAHGVRRPHAHLECRAQYRGDAFSDRSRR